MNLSIVAEEKKAFGVEKSDRRYRLRLARYVGLAETIERHLQHLRSSHGWDQSDGGPLQLLDIGAGHGRTLMYLEARGLDPGIAFHGLDTDPGRLARLYRPERWAYQIHDVERGLPYADASMDIVVCEQVLEHLAHPAQVLDEIRRVLRPGGIAILGVPTFPPVLSQIRRHVVPFFDRLIGKDREHAQAFSRHSFTGALRRVPGFEVEDTYGFRILSGGLLIGLEDFAWWYRFNRWLGRKFPSMVIELQVVVRRTEDDRVSEAVVPYASPPRPEGTRASHH